VALLHATHPRAADAVRRQRRRQTNLQQHLGQRAEGRGCRRCGGRCRRVTRN